jgi:hypothetical protein
MCRWLERDPAGYQDGPSLYSYLGRNPMAGTDPYGLEAVPPGYNGPTYWGEFWRSIGDSYDQIVDVYADILLGDWENIRTHDCGPWEQAERLGGAIEIATKTSLSAAALSAATVAIYALVTGGVAIARYAWNKVPGLALLVWGRVRGALLTLADDLGKITLPAFAYRYLVQVLGTHATGLQKLIWMAQRGWPFLAWALVIPATGWAWLVQRMPILQQLPFSPWIERVLGRGWYDTFGTGATPALRALLELLRRLRMISAADPHTHPTVWPPQGPAMFMSASRPHRTVSDGPAWCRLSLQVDTLRTAAA